MKKPKVINIADHIEATRKFYSNPSTLKVCDALEKCLAVVKDVVFEMENFGISTDLEARALLKELGIKIDD